MSDSYHHGNLRVALIEAGIALINEEGAAHLSLRKLAAACGVSPAAPYSHFSGIEALMLAMQDHVARALMETLTEAVSPYGPDDARRLGAMGSAYVLYFKDRPQHFHFLFSQPVMTIDLSPDSDPEKNFPPFELLRSSVTRLYGNTLSPDRMQDLVIALWSRVHGLAAIASMKNVRYDRRWEDSLRNLIMFESGSLS